MERVAFSLPGTVLADARKHKEDPPRDKHGQVQTRVLQREPPDWAATATARVAPGKRWRIRLSDETERNHFRTDSLAAIFFWRCLPGTVSSLR